MRYIMYGAGAIGGVAGARLFMAEKDVVLIARGDHLRMIQRDGLRLRQPEDTLRFAIPAVSHPSEIDWRPGDVVIMTMKSQDTEAALNDLRLAAGDQVPVVCAQNGIENERMALRRFANVYGMMVAISAGYMEPGLVETSVWPRTGVFDIGRYPSGSDALCEAVAADFEAASMNSQVNADIMPLKNAKLLNNVGNVIAAVCGTEADTKEINALARAEAEACFRAAGLRLDGDALRARQSRNTRVAGSNHFGPNSTWQSLARGAGSSEVDYLNGEIALLGRLHGIATPANEVLQLLGERLTHEHAQPGSMTPESVRELIEQRQALLAPAR